MLKVPNYPYLLIPPLYIYIGKIATVFEEIDPQPHRFWLSVESSKEYVQKISRQRICS